MTEISLLLIFVLCLYTAIGVLDQISIQIGVYTPLFAATVTGALLGNIELGLTVGATLQLMTLAVPIGLLLTQLEISGRMAKSCCQHYAERCAEKGKARGVELANVLGMLPWILSRVIPVFIGLCFGEAVVNSINSFIPVWFMTGLKAAGAILPALGMAILMRYLPLKKYYPYFIIGFVMIAYGGSMFTVLSVALVGFAFAALQYTKMKEKTTAVSGSGSVVVEDDEEVEIDG